MIKYKSIVNKLKINRKNVKYYFYLSIFIYIIGIVLYLVVSYFILKNDLYKNIDNLLKTAANSVEYLLPMNYHDRAINRKAVNEIEFNEMMQLLSNQASNLGVKYIYSLVESNGKLYFTSSSATSYEIRTGHNLTYYWQEYTEAQPQFYEALSTFKTVYIDYTDRWGTFRTILIPKVSPTGNKYLVGADIEISYIDQLIWKGLFEILLKAIFFTLIILPLFYVSYKYFKITKEQLSISLTQKELTAHHERDLRKQSLEKFIQIEEKYAKLLHISYLPFIVIDKRGKIYEYSEAFLDFTGRSSYDFQNNIIFTFPFFFSVNDFEQLIGEIDKHKAIKDYPITLYTKKGETKCKVSGSLLEKQDKNSYLLLFKDFSEENKYIEQIAKAKLFADDLSQRKSLFIAKLSHEMRTPLNVIIGFLNVLKEGKLDNATRIEYINIIQSNAEQLLLLINDVIDFSKIEAGQFTIKEEPCQINLILDQFKIWLEEEIKNKKLSVEINVNKGLTNEEAIIISDELRIKQVLNNLLNNALKFTEKGSINLGYSLTNGFLEFYVKDSGVGMTKDDIQTIFNYFIQGTEGKKSSHKGYGLGLAISKRIVELMGGSIWVESEPGKGTHFYFTIPYKISHVTNKETFSIWNFDVLIADNDKLTVELLSRIIQSHGANVWNVESYEQLIETVERIKEIRFVVFDFDFPIPNIAQFVNYLKRKEKIKIIGISSNIYLININKTNNIGFDGFLAKPFARKEFEMLINKFL